METVNRRLEKVEKTARGGDRRAKEELEHLLTVKEILDRLEPLRKHRESLSEETVRYAEKTLFLLTLKPMMFVANIGEEDLPGGESNPYLQKLLAKAEEDGIPVVTICAEIEAQMIDLNEEERKELLEAYRLTEPGLHRLIRGEERASGSLQTDGAGSSQAHKGGLQTAQSDNLLHHGTEGDKSVDSYQRDKSPSGGREDPLRHGKGIHTRRGDPL